MSIVSDDSARSLSIVSSKIPNPDLDSEHSQQLFVKATHSVLFGKKIDSLEDVYECYNDYSFIKGFGVKKSSSHKSGKDRQLSSKLFTCYAEGKKLLEKEDKVGEKSQKHQKNDIRLDCKANIFVKRGIQDQGWVIVRHDMGNSHPLLNPNETHLLKSYRKITKHQVQQLEEMVKSGIKIIDAYNFMKTQVGGTPELGFLPRDAYNVLAINKREKFTDGDAQELIYMFEGIQKRDSEFFFDYKVDEENHLESVFWRDGAMKDNYLLFGDLLVFDTTFKTNKYGLSCAPFVSMNHHRRNVIVGCGFVKRETISSFDWLFTTFLSSMDNIPPISLITDQDIAMDNAIRKCFPNTLHKLCTWHLGQNAKKHMGTYYQNQGFGDLLAFFLNKCETEEEFISTQQRLEIAYGVGESKWFKGLIKNKQKWSNAFNNNHFTSGALSSQRSESLNSSIRKKRRATMELVDCFYMFCEVIKHWRGKESKDEVANKIGLPSFVCKYSSLIINARKIYTIRAFKCFEEQYKMADGCKQVLQCESDDPNSPKELSYHVFQRKSHQIPESRFTVQYREVDNWISCNCAKLTTTGLLCCHALRILIVHSAYSISQDCYLKRWTKEARPNPVPDLNTYININGDIVQVPVNWHVQQVRKFSRMAMECINNPRARRKCEEGLLSILHDIEMECGKVDIEDGSENTTGKILNPIPNRKKGERTERFKSSVERNSMQKKKGKVNNDAEPHSNSPRAVPYQDGTSHITQTQRQIPIFQPNQKSNAEGMSRIQTQEQWPEQFSNYQDYSCQGTGYVHQETYQPGFLPYFLRPSRTTSYANSESINFNYREEREITQIHVPRTGFSEFEGQPSNARENENQRQINNMAFLIDPRNASC